MTYRYKAPEITDARMYAIEHCYTKLGPDGFAKLMATGLREAAKFLSEYEFDEGDPVPHREILESVARLLDPRPDDDLQLIVERRRQGNPKLRWIQRAEDIEIAREVEHYLWEHLAAGKPNRGSIKLAAREIAKKRGINASTVEQTHRKIRRMIPK
jgi:hypothetical protein